METSQKQIEKNTLVLRLERTQRDVGQLKSKLSSYICEPRTYLLFENMQNLKSRLEQLASTNREIIQALKEHKRSIGDSMENVMQLFTEFQDLQQRVDDYVRGMRNDQYA